MVHFERFVAFTLLHEEIGKSLQKIKSEYMCRFGLRSTDALILAILFAHPDGLSAAALAKECGVDRSVISRALPALLSSGAVAYTEAGNRRRSYRAPLLLTETGTRIITEMNEASVRIVGAASAGVSPEELTVFYRVMRTINKNLADHAEEPEADTSEKGASE